MFRKGSKSKMKDRERNDDFMSQPKQGWLHEEKLLGHGKGVFYCFPVCFVGSVLLKDSLSRFDPSMKSAICREAIAMAMEGSKRRKKVKRKTPKEVAAVLGDTPFTKIVELKLNVSVEGVATAIGQKVLSFDKINRISYASGGQGEDFFCVCYVAKDANNKRFVHVFDCGAVADDVLATIGQCFNLMISQPSHTEEKVLMGIAALQAAPKMDTLPPSRPQPAAPVRNTGPSLPTRNPSMMGARSTPAPPPVRPGAAVQQYNAIDDGIEQYDQVPDQNVYNQEIVYDDGENPDLIYGDDDIPPPVGPKPGDLAADGQYLYGDDDLAGDDIYDSVTFGVAFKKPEELIEFANQQHQSKCIYGEEYDSADIYGDGQTGWGYLDVNNVKGLESIYDNSDDC